MIKNRLLASKADLGRLLVDENSRGTYAGLSVLRASASALAETARPTWAWVRSRIVVAGSIRRYICQTLLQFTDSRPEKVTVQPVIL
jgi:hypothetical protein